LDWRCILGCGADDLVHRREISGPVKHDISLGTGHLRRPCRTTRQSGIVWRIVLSDATRSLHAGQLLNGVLNEVQGLEWGAGLLDQIEWDKVGPTNTFSWPDQSLVLRVQ